jgi:malonyl-CoA O-methyltransferase
LTFTSPQRLLQELRTLGRNLHPARFGSLRGRAWLARLHTTIDNSLRQAIPGGQLQLTFEIIYGHAFKPMPRTAVQPRTTISLDAMRHALRSGNGPS